MITQDQLFRYNGVNSHGNRISGVTNAPNLEAAREELERYYETVQVFPAGLGERPAEMRAGGKTVSFAGDAYANPAKYAPYHNMPAFKEGTQAYKAGNFRNPYPADSVKAQAWDRGLEYGKALEWEERHVGQDAKEKSMKFACDAMPCEGMIINKIGSYLIFEGMASDSGSYFVRNPTISDTRRFDSRADAEDWAREIAMDASDGGPGSGPRPGYGSPEPKSREEIRARRKELEKGGYREQQAAFIKANEKMYAEQQQRKKEKADKEKRDEAVGKYIHDAEMATDPPVSEAQRKAMGAAKSGHSTLSIPSSLGKEFIDADPGGKLPKKANDTAFERDLKDEEPREVIGVKGVQSKPFRKRFPNQKAMERWLDGEGGQGDYEIQYVQRA